MLLLLKYAYTSSTACRNSVICSNWNIQVWTFSSCLTASLTWPLTDILWPLHTAARLSLQQWQSKDCTDTACMIRGFCFSTVLIFYSAVLTYTISHRLQGACHPHTGHVLATWSCDTFPPKKHHICMPIVRISHTLTKQKIKYKIKIFCIDWTFSVRTHFISPSLK